MKNNTTDTKKPSRQEKVQALAKDLEKSIHEFMNGEKYMAFLSSMSKFHTYSLNNQLLIARQRPGATCCASYTTWNRLNRQVRKGESGIKIFCPAPYKSTVLRDAKDPVTGKPCLLPDGSQKKEAVERVIPIFTQSMTSAFSPSASSILKILSPSLIILQSLFFFICHNPPVCDTPSCPVLP